MPHYKGSSNVRSSTYNEKTKELKVTYKGNRQYSYENVPKSVVKRLENAASKGKVVNKSIAYNYPYNRIK